MSAAYAFGFLKERNAVSGHGFEIRPRKDFDRVVANVLAVEAIDNCWFYPPLTSFSPHRISHSCARLELPATHFLITTTRPFDRNYGEFLILALGFLLGLRLTIRGIGHLQRTPHRPGTLVSFAPAKREIPLYLEATTAFWDAHSPEIRRLMFGAIHWFLVSQSFDRQYEKFAWAYTVLDNLHRITWKIAPSYHDCFPLRGKTRQDSHGYRPGALASYFGSELPASFSHVSSPLGKAARLAEYRNNLLHEARWEGEPLGYALSQDGHQMILDLHYFCSQIILGLFGIDCGFRRYTNALQRQGLDLPP